MCLDEQQEPGSPVASEYGKKCNAASAAPATLLRQLLARNPLLFFVFQLRAVASLLHRRNELTRIGFALFDLNDRFVWMRYLSADDARNTFKCRPHFFRTIDGSGHSRNGQVHSFLCLHFGRLRIAWRRSGKSP